MKRLAVGWLLAFALTWVPAPHAAPILFVTTLTGPQEDPPNASPGTGFATLLIDPVANTMSFQTAWAGLLAGTTIAHIHCCTAVPFLGTASPATPTPTFPGFPVAVTAGTYSAIFDTEDPSTYSAGFLAAAGGDPAVAESNFLAGLLSGRAYFNIHTSMFPGGEIRGFLVVPEPSSLALIGLAIVAAATLRRRRA